MTPHMIKMTPHRREMCSLILLFFVNSMFSTTKSDYNVDLSVGLGRRFDGIGAISGGGATSKLLTHYPKEQQSEVLDYLFKPNFGASLQILKVEIGGDAQSSEGTESSHMHEPWDENYQRGYEWWMMKEAKKRNPNILLYGLPWGYPGWLGQGEWWPFKYPNVTADYITRWVLGAKKYYDLDINYLGIWNEKWYEPAYVKALRKTLDARGLKQVQIVAADLLPTDCWDIVKDVDKDPELKAAINILSCHYCGLSSSDQAKKSGKPLWASEDWGHGGDDLGGGYMARLLNRNYVNGLMTSTIVWNALYAYYPKLDYPYKGLMQANEPWSGHYEVPAPIWTVAHTTQFTAAGWHYLSHGSGVGWLDGGGSYVTLISPDSKHISIIIETMNALSQNSGTLQPEEKSHVKTQNVTFSLKGQLSKLPQLELWFTRLGLGSGPSVYLKHMGAVKVINGKFSLSLEVNSVYTLTTVTTAQHGEHGPPPKPAPFTLPYKDNFDAYPEHQEANYLTQQVGAFEIHPAQGQSQGHGKVLRQMLLHAPVHWCPELQSQPMAVMGNYTWGDIEAEIQVYVSSTNGTDGVFLALRVDQASCETFLAKGLFFWILFPSKTFQITSDLTRTESVATGPVDVTHDTWYTLNLRIKGQEVRASLGGKQLYTGTLDPRFTQGFVALGTNNFGKADFDNFVLNKPGL